MPGGAGRCLWLMEAQPKINGYCAQALGGFSGNDIAHSLHYLLRLLENMQRIDNAQGGGREAECARGAPSSSSRIDP